MSLDMLRKKDPMGAFSEFVEMWVAKKSGVLPEDYHELFPNECDCGAPYIITKSRSRFMCSNPTNKSDSRGIRTICERML